MTKTISKRVRGEGLESVPSRVFLTKGQGVAKEKLTSFEMALRNAKISQLNLVRVSSIFPPHCKVIQRKRGIELLKPGQIVYCVLSENSTNEPHRQMAASIGLAVPKDRTKYGYISEHHSFGHTEAIAGDFVEDLAASMLATILGVPFDPDTSYDERKEIYKISNQIVRTKNITETTRGDKDGRWTTVLAAAVFVP